MFYGYARVITMGQARESNSLEAQESALQQAGTERIFWDVFSRKPERRPQSFVLNMGIIDDIPTGRLIQNIMLSFSEFKHDVIVQRTQGYHKTKIGFQ